ncbi:MAG: deoxyribose-phosphate aldolase [Planctomycetota bacterium]
MEHTLLRADATEVDVERLHAEAARWGCFGVCVHPVRVAALAGRGLPVVTVTGVPFGADRPDQKADGARRAEQDGAQEVDMVVAIGAARDGDWSAYAADVRAVRQAIPQLVLKTILETGLLDEAQLREAARIAAAEGVDFLKTSTGYGPRGASVDDVRLLREFGAVKAAGGIRTRADAEAMRAAGATRIGASSTAAILGDEAHG